MSRILCFIAGIDREIIENCPKTDKLWAGHLGFALFLSLLVVGGITFQATSYVVTDFWLRVIVSAVIALTIFMFDRALYQSDWFIQGSLNSFGHRIDWLRAVRIIIRLVISFSLAYVLSVFLELAIFDGAITDQIQRNSAVKNALVLERIRLFEVAVDDDIQSKRKAVSKLLGSYDQVLTGADLEDANVSALREATQKALQANSKRRENLQLQLSQINADVAKHQQDMAAEELGQRLRPENSQIAGRGPLFELAQRQLRIAEQKKRDLLSELTELDTGDEEARDRLAALVKSTRAAFDATREARAARVARIAADVAEAQKALSSAEGSRAQRIVDNRRSALGGTDYLPPKSDPLTRMTAYRQIREDPVDGPTIIAFSYMTKIFIIFLEVVPVLAKMFFSPPSVYAAKLQLQLIEAERNVLERQADIEDVKSTIASKQRVRRDFLGDPIDRVIAADTRAREASRGAASSEEAA